MDDPLRMPPLDPFGLPATLLFIQILHLLTLLLHLVAMNFMVTAAGAAAITRLRIAKAGTGSTATKLYSDAVNLLPYLVAATVTLGIAPLLFSQVIYGHTVYPAGIAIGWFWWGVIPLLVAAYYGFYLLKLRNEAGRKVSSLVPFIALLILIWISFIFSNNFNLSGQPDRIEAMIRASSAGWQLNLSDPTTFPRWLHMVVGAVAVGGVGMMWLGWMKLKIDPEYGARLLRLGQQLFIHPTTANIVIGFAFMMTLKRPVMMKLMGQGLLETGLWFIGMGAALAAIPVFNRAAASRSFNALLSGSVLLALTLAAMVWLRERVRIAYLEPYFNLSDWTVNVQTGPIILFLLTFLLGIGVMVWLIRLAGTKPH